MQIRVDGDNKVYLDDAFDFRRFSLFVEQDVSQIERVREALSGIVTLLESSTAWVEVAALRNWSALTQSGSWQDELTLMIEKARPYGWYDEKARTLKAHIEWQIFEGNTQEGR